MQATVQQAEASFGPCDFMVCNAGATQPGKEWGAEGTDGVAVMV